MHIVGRLAALLGILALLAGLGWIALGTSGPRAGAAAPRVHAPDEPTDEALALGPEFERREREHSEATAPTPALDEVAAEIELFPLVLQFARGDHKPLRVPSASVTLTRESDGEVVTLTAQDEDRVAGSIGLGSWRIEASVPEHRHISVVHEFTAPATGFQKRLYLWPEARLEAGTEAWLPVVVRTADERPFEQLARDQGLEPRRYFSRAFGVEASRDRAFTQLGGEHSSPPLANFHTPRTTWGFALAESIAGSLEVLEPRPFWVRLTIHGAPQASQFVGGADTEVVFEIDMQTLRSSFASLSLRLRDRSTGEPVTDAVSTLKADNSSHRRNDLQDVSPDEDGRLLFEDVIPGTHDLLITRGGNFVQRKIRLSPGQDLDLGEVGMGSGRGVLIRVVDGQRAPVSAWIEIAPYERGRATSSLYHPNLHRLNNRDGEYLMPLPEGPSIVRARAWSSRAGLRGFNPVSTRNVVIDPEFPPREVLLVSHDPTTVRFESSRPWAEGHILTVNDDALGLTIARIKRLSKSLSLVPGRYSIHRWEDALEVGTVHVVIGSQPLTVQVP